MQDIPRDIPKVDFALLASFQAVLDQFYINFNIQPHAFWVSPIAWTDINARLGEVKQIIGYDVVIHENLEGYQIVCW